MTKYYHYLRHPKTTNEKRANAVFKGEKRNHKVGGRLRTKGTSSRLADVYDDIENTKKQDKYYRKKTHSAARKAKEAERKIAMAA